jgi:ABC-type multidrug transport system fused ATPase/permease subunit
MLVAVPIQGIMFGKTMAINRAMVKFTDQRVKTTNEILQGILGIKMAGLESKYAEVVNREREKEISSLRRVVFLSAFNTAFMTSMPSATAVLSLTVYALSQDGNVSAPTLFTALTAFGQLRFPLMFYPQALIALSQAKVSIKRVADFLALEEIGRASTISAGAGAGADTAESGGGDASRAPPTAAASPSSLAQASSASTSPLPSPSGSTRALQQAAAVEIKNGEFFWARPGTAASLAAAKAAEKAANMSRKERRTQKKKLSMVQKTSSLSSSVPGASRDGVGSSNNNGASASAPSFRGKDLTTGISVRGVNDVEAPAPEQILEERAVLTGINLRVTQGSLVAVIGPVGSGKSSLVSSILDEMYRNQGSLSVSGSVAYASQTAWILNATVRENILFGQPMDDRRYHKVVKACQLSHDLEVLEAGDQTMIGERGINLSGGQKQRISVARAVYSNRDIIILDDPLSALDPEVAAKVFKLCFKKLLRGKTRILVTNQLQFLEHCDSVVVLDAQPNEPGRIVEHGPYKRLITSGLNFQRVMAKYNSSENESQQQEASATAAALLKVDEAEEEDLDEDKSESAGAPDNEAQLQEQSRPESQDSQDSQTDEAAPTAKKPAKALMQVEERSKGAVPLGVYIAYAKAGGNYPWFASFTLFLFLVAQLAVLINTWWLTYWTADTNPPTPYSEHPFSFYLWGYFLTVVALALIAYVRSLAIYYLALRASMQLHSGLLNSVLHAPMSYFDTTPIGRIVSRFSKDLYLLDTQLVMSVQFFLFTVFFVLFSFGAIAYGVPWFLLSLPIVCYLYLLALNYYRPLARDSKRLESISRSPIFAHFSETLGGLTTIRAYGISDAFVRTNARMVDNNIKSFFVTVAIQRWLALRLEWLGACISVLAAVLSVVAAQNGQLTASRAGFALSFLFGLTNLLNQTVRQFADVETGMNSVERLLHYTSNIEQEAPFESPTPPPKGWPERGEIVVKDLRMRYRKDTPLVLKGVNIKVPAGSRVGIVGRTGSGKSSMLLTLLRLVEPEPSSDGSGPIVIDGVDTCKIGLHELRQHVSIVPQNPTIFSGTVRSNLDPFQLYSDETIWAALAECEMKAAVEEAGGLDGAVAEYGENFSQGQRQLLCLTKSVLSKAKMYVNRRFFTH